MTLLAGTASREITPPDGSMMAAFPHRPYVEPRRAAGSHDPLKARALVLKTDAATVAICSVDLVWLSALSVKRIRASLAREVPELAQARPLFAASHTHAGAETSFLFGATPDDETIKKIERQIGEAVKDACRDLTPVRLSWGRTTLEKTHNRRVLDGQGQAQMCLEHVPGKTTGPVDTDLHVMRFDRPDGAAKAALFHYTAHALTLGPKNMRFSADFPGRACSILETAWPGCPALFLNGAAGNIHPHHCMRAGTDARDAMGQAVADAALAASRNAATVEDPVLALASDCLTFANRRDPSLVVELEVNALRLGPLVLGFVPGEFFVEFQLAFKRGIAPHPGTLVGYANGAVGYAPTLAAYKEGGYGVTLADRDPPQWCRTSLPPGAGEQAIERLLELAEHVMQTP